MKWILIITVGIIAGALSYWFNPYNEMELFGVHIYKIMISATFLGSLILTFFLNEKPWKISLLVSLGVLFSVICRIFFDIANDSGTHNLFPFEIIATSFITIPSAFVGSYLSHLITRHK